MKRKQKEKFIKFVKIFHKKYNLNEKNFYTKRSLMKELKLLEVLSND
jgi:hypothetical protein